MIFVTTGTQLPFDRLMAMVDEIAPLLGGEEVVVQAAPGNYTPVNFTPQRFISPEKFEELMDSARVVVAHAGIGSIISAMKRRKPFVVVARMASLGEHRNDHQMATARSLASRAGVAVATDARSLLRLVTEPRSPEALSAAPSASLVSAAAAALGLVK